MNPNKAATVLTLFDLQNIVSTLFLFETQDKSTFVRLINMLTHHLKKENPIALDSFFIWLKNFLLQHIDFKALNAEISKIRSIKEFAMLANKFKRWEAEFKEEGYEKGIEKGREEEKKILTRTMLENGADIGFISKVTGCSAEFLKKLKRSVDPRFQS